MDGLTPNEAKTGMTVKLAVDKTYLHFSERYTLPAGTKVVVRQNLPEGLATVVTHTDIRREDKDHSFILSYSKMVASLEADNPFEAFLAPARNKPVVV